MKTQLQEINEAIEAGYQVLEQLQIVEDNLRRAQGWGIVDMFSKGGFISALLKHSRLSDAEAAMNELTYRLNRFNSELSDIHISNNVGQITMGTGMQLADWFFDGLIVDVMALSRIGESQRQVADLRRQIENAMDRLFYLKNVVENQGTN